MKRLLAALDRWRDSGTSGAVATVVATWRSAPQPVGARMLVDPDGAMAGSVSGGCVEADVVEVARQVIGERRPRLLRYGVADEAAWSVGLSCGGEIAVWVEPAEAWQPLAQLLAAAAATRRAVCVATWLVPEFPLKVGLMDGGNLEVPASLTEMAAGAPVPAIAEAAMRDALRSRRTEVIAESAGGGGQVFLDVMPPPPRLVVVGAVHIAQALVPMARLMGFECWVVDPRADLATAERFPDADRLVVEWPDQALESIEPDSDTFVVTLSHDDKLDVPALALAAQSAATYVGALGSTRTQAARREALRARGVSGPDADRIHGPVGLDIGARTPEEIALAVMAQIVAARRGLTAV